MDKNQDILLSRTSPDCSPRTKARTSGQSSKKSFKSWSRQPRCLRLKKGNGQTPTISWETDGPLRIEFLMRNGGAFPKEDNESFLSQILQANVPQRFYLSRKACLGILRRASARGKELPTILKTALERQAERMKDAEENAEETEE